MLPKINDQFLQKEYKQQPYIFYEYKELYAATKRRLFLSTLGIIGSLMIAASTPVLFFLFPLFFNVQAYEYTVICFFLTSFSFSIYFLIRNNGIKKQFIVALKENIFPDFIPQYFPDFNYQTVTKYNGQALFEWHTSKRHKPSNLSLSDPRFISCQHQISAQLNNLSINILSDIQNKYRAYNMDQAVVYPFNWSIKGIWIEIGNLPENFSLDQLEADPDLKAYEKQMRDYWQNYLVKTLIDKSLVIYIKTDQKFLQPSFRRKYDEEPLEHFFKQLFYSLNYIELFSKRFSS